MEDGESKCSKKEGFEKCYGSDEVERELVRCLSGDAKAVARVCTDIVSWTGPVQQAAWENPNKNVNLLQILEQPPEADLQYVPALEQTLDILQLYLKLIVSYFNQMPPVMEEFKSSDMTIASKRITLPALVWMLWSRVRFINDELFKDVKYTGEKVNYVKDEKFTQTEIACFTACENCSLSQDVLTKIIELTEKICTNLHIKGSQILELRKSMAEDVFNITQWSAISKWCEAILNDIDLLGNLSWQSTYQSKKAQSKIKQIKQATIDYEERLKLLEDEKIKLRADVDKAYESKATYIAKVTDLTSKLKTKNGQIEAMEKKCSELEALVQTMKQEMSDFKKSSIKEKERFIDVNKEIQSKIDEIEKMKEQLNEQQTEQCSKSFDLQTQIANQEMLISNLEGKITSLNKELENSLKREESLKMEIIQEQNHGAVIWKNYETLKEAIRRQEELISEKERSEQILISTVEGLKKQLTCNLNKDIEYTGDPIRDMETQKKENEAIIKRLSDDNMLIEKTLNKLYTMAPES